MSPIVVRLTDVPGFAALQGLGHRILGLALLLWLGVETYKLVTRGQCDYLTPVLRVGLGSALLASLPSLHATATSLFDGAASDLADANVLGLFVTAYEHMLQGATGGPASAGQAPGFLDTVALVGQVFSFQGMMALGSVGLAVAMLVAKVLIIDLLWPLCLGLVMVLGTLAVPLGVLPGLGTLKGWLKNLIEVALWPVIFQLVVGLMASSFKGLLTAVRQVDFLQVFSDPTAPGDQLLLLTRWWALCLLYVLLLLLTPLLSMMVVRSTPVGVVGGIVAAQAARLAAGAVGGLAGGGLGKFVAGAAGRLAGAGASGAGAAGLATASAVVGQVAGATTAGASGGPSLDRRTHRTAGPAAPQPEGGASMTHPPYPDPVAPPRWPSIGRDLVVAVIGPEALAAPLRREGVRLVAMPNTERFVELQGYLAPDSIDACVVARDPWRGCNGLQLARDLRARLIGTVLVSDQVAEHLVQERLTVVPVGAEVRPGDLEAALMVAAQETWMLAAMMDAAAAQAPARARDPWAEDEPTLPSPAEHVWSGVGAARPAQIAPSVTASVPLPTLEIQLFGDLSGFEGPALEAPMPPRISAPPPGPTPPPSWAGSTTRQVEVSASLLAQLAMDASGAPPAPPPPVPAPPAPPPPAAVPARRGPPPVPAPSGVWAAAMRTQEATQVDLLPPPRRGGWVAGITAEMTSRWLVWGAALLGVAVGMAVWLR